MKLYELRNGQKLSTHAAANYPQQSRGRARKGPYQVNILRGVDADVDGEPVPWTRTRP